MFMKCQSTKFTFTVFTPLLHNFYRRESTCSELLNLQNLSPYITNMCQATKNEVSDVAANLEKKLAEGSVKLPFRKVIRADIFDPQAVNSFYVTYGRQLLAVMCLRRLFKDPAIPEDVKNRAYILKKYLGFGSIGIYGPHDGISFIRRNVAQYIAYRDKVTTNMNDIFLCEGVGDAFRNVTKMLYCKVNGKRPVILLPIPHHPMYSALIQSYGMKVMHYKLDKNNEWAININNLRRTVSEARYVYHPRALVIINPNITGNVLSLQNLREIIKLAHEEKLILIADESYQNNIYQGRFYSIRKAQRRSERRYHGVELVSLMSLSEGWFGECGIKSGYIELANFEPDIVEVYFNILSLSRNPNIPGQILMDVLVNPPDDTDESHMEFIREKKQILALLKKKSQMAVQELEGIKGFTCSPIRGGVSAFPEIYLPRKARKKAVKANLPPDVYFALKLLKETGVSVIPGSYLGMPNNKFHLCFTILPHIDQFQIMLKRIKGFYEKFYKEHKSFFLY